MENILLFLQANWLTMLGIALGVIVVLGLTLYVAAEMMRPHGGGKNWGRVTSILLLPFYGLALVLFVLFSIGAYMITPIIVWRRNRQGARLKPQRLHR